MNADIHLDTEIKKENIQKLRESLDGVSHEFQICYEGDLMPATNGIEICDRLILTFTDSSRGRVNIFMNINNGESNE